MVLSIRSDLIRSDPIPILLATFSAACILFIYSSWSGTRVRTCLSWSWQTASRCFAKVKKSVRYNFVLKIFVLDVCEHLILCHAVVLFSVLEMCCSAKLLSLVTQLYPITWCQFAARSFVWPPGHYSSAGNTQWTIPSLPFNHWHRLRFHMNCYKDLSDIPNPPKCKKRERCCVGSSVPDAKTKSSNSFASAMKELRTCQQRRTGQFIH